MQTALTAKQAKNLAKLFTSFAATVQAYRDKNYTTMSPEEEMKFGELICELTTLSNELITTAVGMLLDDAANSLAQIQDAIKEADQAIGKLKEIQHTLSVITAVVGLAATITTGNFTGILPAIQNVIAKSG